MVRKRCGEDNEVVESRYNVEEEEERKEKTMERSGRV